MLAVSESDAHLYLHQRGLCSSPQLQLHAVKCRYCHPIVEKVAPSPAPVPRLIDAFARDSTCSDDDVPLAALYRRRVGSPASNRDSTDSEDDVPLALLYFPECNLLAQWMIKV